MGGRRPTGIDSGSRSLSLIHICRSPKRAAVVLNTVTFERLRSLTITTVLFGVMQVDTRKGIVDRWCGLYDSNSIIQTIGLGETILTRR